MAVPQRHYSPEEEAQYDMHHLNVLRHVSDIFAASISYATELAEIRYAECSDDDMAYLERKYGRETGQVVTGLVREAAELVGVSLQNYRVVEVQPKKFAESPRLIDFYELIEQLQSTE